MSIRPPISVREQVRRESAQLVLGLDTRRLRQRYLDHRARFPWVWSALRDLALEAKRRGRARYSIAALFEIARWERETRGLDDAGWKLDNSMRAFYSRALQEEVPELAGFFETRTQRSL